ncbi:hypothetical protein QFC21_000767 [Naganishia friedmannii]|uniref:Uncharacterized protein n=1 Tax=Naganishia friedmannii TaxID=89922 RepID=A0ACC2W6P7_9TREE|nr:hypothetical protein QFC21_000767 [Naganishia friedmannii]
MNGISNAINGINGHSRAVSDSTSFGDLSSSKSSEPDIGMQLEIPFEVPTPIQPAAPAARNPPHAERDPQSARASSLIGDMLLRGYSLLADSCPNSTCYGIPLVGQPRTRRPGGRDAGLEDTRKQCVICNRVYDKFGNLVQGGSTARPEDRPAAVNGVQDGQRSTAPAAENSTPDSPRTLARRALYADGEQANVALRTANKAVDQPDASKPLPESNVAIPQRAAKLSRADTSKSHQVVSESVDTLVMALERLNSELRRMMEHPDIGRTIKDKGMKRCLTRMRDTMEALALAEEVRAKMEQ